ncbi:MAG TPA: hypothetical protein VKA14_07825, partial [Gammaproteobacteria bacterium]|nr:hypothetical protein [Gammaproteobacteria bacterium]
AGTGIGDPLTVDTPNITARSDAGDINLIDLRGLDSSDFDAKRGSVHAVIHGDFHFNAIRTGQNVTGRADGNVDGTQVDAPTGTVDLSAGGAMDLGTVDSGRDQSLTAAGDLAFTTLTSGADVTGTSTGGAVKGGSVDARGSVDLNAAQAVGFDTVSAGQDVDLKAGTSLTGNQLTATGGDVNAVAGTDLDIKHVRAGGSGSLTAGAGMQFDSVSAGQDADLKAGTSLTGNQLTATGGDVNAVAGTDLDIHHVRAGGSGSLTAGAAMHFDTIAVGKDLALKAAGSMNFGGLNVGDGLSMDSTNGSITGTRLSADHASLSALHRIDVQSANVARRLNLAADDGVNVNATQAGNAPASVGGAGPASPLVMTVTGYRNGVARKVQLSVDAPAGLDLQRLAGANTVLQTSARRVDMKQADVPETLRLITPVTELLVDNTTPRLSNVDVQLTEPDHGFRLLQNGIRTTTTAYVMHYARGYEVEVPNFDQPHRALAPMYRGESAVRYTFRGMSLDLASGTRRRFERQSPSYAGILQRVIAWPNPVSLQGTSGPAVNPGP